MGCEKAERRKVNVLEIKCLRSLVIVSRMDRVKNEEVHRRAGIEMEYGQKGVDGRSQWGMGMRETKVRLDGWCEGGLRQQRNDSGGLVHM